MSSFRDLRVWQAGLSLAERVYAVTRAFPRSETYGLASQLQRAAVSVPSNIAEGHARQHTKEYLHHLSVAPGSLAEVETQLEIAVRLGYLSRAACDTELTDIRSLGRQLTALYTAITSRIHSVP
ncbi:MAG: four helix bundle protein [Chloroflexi bacterium]|nr:four helix bundle protein [Chloroflexota bacterium]